MIMVNDPCIIPIVTLYSKIFKTCKNCHGLVLVLWMMNIVNFNLFLEEQIVQLLEPSFVTC